MKKINRAALLWVMLIQFNFAFPHKLQNIQPDFLTAMDSWQQYGSFNKTAALQDAYTLKAMEFYNKFWAQGIQTSNEPIIPKIIHQIWLGSPFPEKYKKFQKTWKLHHPDWTYILWTEKEIADFGLLNKKLFDAVSNWGQKSDIARYEILYRLGGLYVDTDFECLKPCDILHHSLDFYTSCLPSSNGSLNNCLLNGLLAARPGHPILKACVEGLKNANYAGKQSIDDILAQTGPHYFTKIVFTTLDEACGRSVIFPPSFFYPLPNIFGARYISPVDLKKNFIHDETFAIHWWACSWMSNKNRNGKCRYYARP
jgi:mannosyltransferase OCH1-like enzyme